MRLVYIKLKNVAGIKAGLGIKTLEIDFNKGKYDFNIINGTNGSGKSTLLNSIDPYAVEKIVRDKKGYKEIHYEHKGEIYIVKHFYEPTKTGHSVKSFLTKIDKNGIMKELNENGNVTSFKEIISIQLGVTPETMRLLKLGSDAVNIVNMTPAERKKFMSKFTADVDIYLALYKKINNDYLILSKLVKNYSDKLKSLGKLSDVESNIEYLDEEIVKLENEETKCIINMTSLCNKKESLWDNDKKERLLLIEDKFENNRKTKNKIEKEFGLDILNKDTITIKENIQNIEFKIKEKSNSIDIYEQSKSNIENDIGNIRDKIYNINIELDKLNIGDYDEGFIDELDELKEFSNKYEDTYNKYKDLINIINKPYLLELEKYFVNKQEVLSGILDKCNNGELEQFDLDTDYNSLYIKTTQNIWKYKTIIERYEDKNINDINKELENINCDNIKCPLLASRLNELNKIKEEEKEYNDTINKLNKEEINSEIYFNMDRLKTLLIDIKNKLNELNPDIKKILKISFKDIYKMILNGNSYFYNTDNIVSLISKIEIVNEYNDNKDKIHELQILEKDLKYKSSLDNELEINNKHLKDLIDKKNKYDNDIKNNKSKLEELIESKDNLEYLLENKQSFDELSNMENEINLLKMYKEQSIELQSEIMDIKDRLENINKEKDELNKNRDKQIYLKKTIKKTTKQKEAYEYNFKDIEVIRKVLSTNKGIPLIFVKSYLQKTRKLVNDILEDVFDGEKKLDKFVINDKEFRIPLITGNEINEDISNASSGERSIISLAFTLALTEQNKISNMMYRILLLDEVDGPLDAKKRRKFLNLLEKRTKKLKIKQSFMITHNDCFNDYPVNLILFKGHTINDTKNKNIIYSYE